MRLDEVGIPRVWRRTTGAVYRPGFIAWWGLVNLGHYLRHRDQVSLDVFVNQLNWLEQNAVHRADGAVVWPMNFDCREGRTLLKAPWRSCNSQGLAISALVVCCSPFWRGSPMSRCYRHMPALGIPTGFHLWTAHGFFFDLFTPRTLAESVIRPGSSRLR